jgi:hypothetical protein
MDTEERRQRARAEKAEAERDEALKSYRRANEGDTRAWADMRARAERAERALKESEALIERLGQGMDQNGANVLILVGQLQKAEAERDAVTAQAAAMREILVATRASRPHVDAGAIDAALDGDTAGLAYSEEMTALREVEREGRHFKCAHYRHCERYGYAGGVAPDRTCSCGIDAHDAAIARLDAVRAKAGAK